MCFGIVPPVYKNPIEQMAFNLYAMNIEQEEEELAAARLQEDEGLEEADGKSGAPA